MKIKDAFGRHNKVLSPEDLFTPDLADATPEEIESIARHLAEDDPLEAIKMLLESVQSLQKEKVQLEGGAFKDALTGLYNKRAYNMLLDYEIKHAVREKDYKGPSLLYGDLSLFKHVNDTHGHAAGDLALKKVAEALQKTCRDSDAVARLGGDEFAVILPHDGKQEADMMRDRIVETFKDFSFDYEGKSLRVGINLGVAEYEAGDTAHTLTDRADRIMQQVKESDPNRRGRTRAPEGPTPGVN